MLKGANSFRSKFKILKGANSFWEQILSLKDRKTAILNAQNIRMLQIHVNNDIYNKYCLIYNNSYILGKFATAHYGRVAVIGNVRLSKWTHHDGKTSFSAFSISCILSYMLMNMLSRKAYFLLSFTSFLKVPVGLNSFF